MAPIPKGGAVAVTGAAGFIGGWLVRELLEGGYRVRACVRDVDDLVKGSGSFIPLFLDRPFGCTPTG